jgi:SHS2 domain-containing protein
MAAESRAFEFVSHTADIAAIIYGQDMPELLRNGAAALYALTMTGLHATTTHCRCVAIESADRSTMLVDWLNELIYYLYAEKLAFSEFQFDELGETSLMARCRGSRLGMSDDVLRCEVKAATYHMARIVHDASGMSSRVVFDV